MTPPAQERAAPSSTYENAHSSAAAAEPVARRVPAVDRPTPLEMLEAAEASISMEDRLQEVADQIRQAASAFSKKLDFLFDKATGRLVVRVMNADTNEVIREMPPQKLLELAAKIQEDLGVIFDEFA